jgi:hypothetical protein
VASTASPPLKSKFLQIPAANPAMVYHIFGLLSNRQQNFGIKYRFFPAKCQAGKALFRRLVVTSQKVEGDLWDRLSCLSTRQTEKTAPQC